MCVLSFTSPLFSFLDFLYCITRCLKSIGQLDKSQDHTQMYGRSTTQATHKPFLFHTSRHSQAHILTLISLMPARPWTHYKTLTHYWHLFFPTQTNKLVHSHMPSHTYTIFSLCCIHRGTGRSVYRSPCFALAFHLLTVWADSRLFVLLARRRQFIGQWRMHRYILLDKLLLSDSWKKIATATTSSINSLLNQSSEGKRSESTHCETLREVVKC